MVRLLACGSELNQRLRIYFHNRKQLRELADDWAERGGQGLQNELIPRI